MRPIHAVIVVLAILPSPASAQFAVTFGPRGEVAELRVEDVVYFTDLVGFPRPDDRPLAIHGVTADRPRVPVYSRVELSADVTATYTNPFDPEEICVDAAVTTPGGATVLVPGFYLVPVSFETTLDTERMRITGPPGFRVRYTPTEPGEYRVVLQARDRSGSVCSAPITLVATPSDHPGFVRRAQNSPRYFALDNGQSYFAIGENLAWSSSATPLADYEKWLRGLGAAGGNWARLFLSYAEKGQEWSAPPTPRPGRGTYPGLGRYAQDTSARLDEIVRLAEQHGVRLMFCIGAYMEFYDGGFFNEGAWVSNPYNAANGGPCVTADDFWIHPEARRFYRQRLRYLIARWGYSPTLFAWEFWNEVPATPTEEAWIAEMAAYLKQHDPNRHLVSTTYGAAATWECPDVDFSMKHVYGAANITDFTPLLVQQAEECLPFGKPYLPAEFGVDWQTGDDRWDLRGTGINMHNGAWTSLASGAAGTTMLWYWDSYVHPNDLYRVFTPVRKFADTVDWANTCFNRLAGIEVSLSEETPEVFSDLMIPGTLEWGVTPSNEYTARRDGSVLGGPVSVTLGSPGRGNPGELFSEMTWHVDMPSAGTVLMKLGQVANAARLQIRVDGELRVDRPLVSGEPGKGPWKSARYLEQYKLWISNYDQDIPIEVAAGRHDITIANAEGDWLQVRSITLPAYRSNRFPEVNVIGLQSDHLLIVWLHNQESTWRTEFDGKQPREFAGLRLSVPISAEDAWRVEWWDTFTGEVLRAEQVQPHDGKLTLQAPAFTRDLALRIERVR